MYYKKIQGREIKAIRQKDEAKLNYDNCFVNLDFSRQQVNDLKNEKKKNDLIFLQ